MNETGPDAAALLGQPLELPCGVILKNRLIKSAMSDSLGDGAGNPTGPQIRLYERWAEGGAALSLIGEVQITSDYPEKPGNLVLTPDINVPEMRELARRGSANNTHIWPQLGHAGALAHEPISTPKGPSPLNLGGLKVEELSLQELEGLPSSFADAAGLARDLGFSGVLIHAGHGFLLSQFLSPLFNHRDDAYGGSIENRFRILREVIAVVRNSVGHEYPIGIKINATDRLTGGLTTQDALQVIRLLNETSVDLIDISGGTYFPGAVASSDGLASSGPYFADFAQKAKTVSRVPISLSGGFQTRKEAIAALKLGQADAISLGRAMALNPSLASAWLSGKNGDPSFPAFQNPPRGGVTAWYTMRLTALGEDREDQFDLSPTGALETYNKRDSARCEIWRQRFSH